MRYLLLAILVPVISGCGITDWFAGDQANKPAELTTFESKIQPKILWSVDLGVGSDNQALALSPAITDEVVFVADAIFDVLSDNCHIFVVQGSIHLVHAVEGGWLVDMQRKNQ